MPELFAAADYACSGSGQSIEHHVAFEDTVVIICQTASTAELVGRILKVMDGVEIA